MFINRVIIVTGTNTDVGKTFITSNLVAQLLKHNHQVLAYKPIQTGNVDLAEDLLSYRNFVTTFFPPDQVKQRLAQLLTSPRCYSYLFQEPASPHLAARLENTTISIDTIICHLVALLRDAKEPAQATITQQQVAELLQSDYTISRDSPKQSNLDNSSPIAVEPRTLVIELAGGILSPMNDNATNLDFIRMVQQLCSKFNLTCQTCLVTNEQIGSISPTLSCIYALGQLDYLIVNHFRTLEWHLASHAIPSTNFDYFIALQQQQKDGDKMSETARSSQLSKLLVKPEQEVLQEINLTATTLSLIHI